MKVLKKSYFFCIRPLGHLSRKNTSCPKVMFIGKTKEMLDDGGHLSVDVSLPGCYNSYNFTTQIEGWTTGSRVGKTVSCNILHHFGILLCISLHYCLDDTLPCQFQLNCLPLRVLELLTVKSRCAAF